MSIGTVATPMTSQTVPSVRWRDSCYGSALAADGLAQGTEVMTETTEQRAPGASGRDPVEACKRVDHPATVTAPALSRIEGNNDDQDHPA